MSLVVYTSITHGYDTLRPVAAHLREGAQFVAFVEQAHPSDPWETRPLARLFPDPVRNAKMPKILPQHFFPASEYSLWLDGKMEAKTPVVDLLELLQDADLAVFKHALRCCLFDEACQCLHQRLDDPAIIYRQIQRYTREGFPANWGLYDCAVLLRRHSAKMAEFSQMWWHEIENGSRRDQLSFTYCAWKCGLKIRSLPGFSHDNQFFRIHPHLQPFPAAPRQPTTRSTTGIPA